MDNEISEGLHLGTTLMLSVAVAVFLTTVSGIVRNGYIYRERNVQYSIEVQDRLLWKKLCLMEDYSSGIANKKHYTDLDTTLKFINDISDSYSWAIVLLDENNIWQGYTNITLSNAQKNHLKNYTGNTSCVWHTYSNVSETVTAMINDLYAIQSARSINGKTVENKVSIHYWQFIDYIGEKEPIQWFDTNFVPSELCFQLYVIN